MCDTWNYATFRAQFYKNSKPLNRTYTYTSEYKKKQMKIVCVFLPRWLCGRPADV